MPQFHLNTPPRRAHAFYDLSDFAKGYVEAMFFTNGDTGEEREDLLNDLGVERLTRAAVADIAQDCAAFLAHEVAPGVTVQSLLDLIESDPGLPYSTERAGNDFWFTRQGHGVGFWDREEIGADVGIMPDGQLLIGVEAEESGAVCLGALRDLLTDAAKAMGEVYPSVNRGWIYH